MLEMKTPPGSEKKATSTQRLAPRQVPSPNKAETEAVPAPVHRGRGRPRKAELATGGRSQNIKAAANRDIKYSAFFSGGV